MDFSEVGNAFVVRAELPGVEINDVTVSMCGEILTVKGEKKQDEGGSEFRYFLQRQPVQQMRHFPEQGVPGGITFHTRKRTVSFTASFGNLFCHL